MCIDLVNCEFGKKHKFSKMGIRQHVNSVKRNWGKVSVGEHYFGS